MSDHAFADNSLIPVAIVGATRFYATLVNILSTFHPTFSYLKTDLMLPLGVIGYWSTAFAAIILVEHFHFRKGNWENYDVPSYNDAAALPLGASAVLAFFCAFGLIVPSMSQVWYVGPIAKAGTGDIGILTGGVSAALFYTVFRTVEKRFTKKRLA